MANENFIMITLNLTPSQIHDLSTVIIDGILHIRITLTAQAVECPFCGGRVTRKKNIAVLKLHILTICQITLYLRLLSKYLF